MLPFFVRTPARWIRPVGDSASLGSPESSWQPVAVLSAICQPPVVAKVQTADSCGGDLLHLVPAFVCQPPVTAEIFDAFQQTTHAAILPLLQCGATIRSTVAIRNQSFALASARCAVPTRLGRNATLVAEASTASAPLVA